MSTQVIWAPRALVSAISRFRIGTHIESSRLQVLCNIYFRRTLNHIHRMIQRLCAVKLDW
jgi:hypothetical protein